MQKKMLMSWLDLTGLRQKKSGCILVNGTDLWKVVCCNTAAVVINGKFNKLRGRQNDIYDIINFWLFLKYSDQSGHRP